MASLPLLATLLVLTAQEPVLLNQGGSSEPGLLRTAPVPARPGVDRAAEEFLRHLYAVYLALRACTEASQQIGKPEYMPTVSLEEARRTMRTVDEASKEVGLDVDRIWAEIGPVGLITAEAIKTDTPNNLANCRNIGGIFRFYLGNLKNTLKDLGYKRSLIEKDF